MATEVLTPISDGNTGWVATPSGTRHTCVDEGHLTPNYADYVSASTNGQNQIFGFSVLVARNIDAVSNVRVYFPLYGLLGASSGMAVQIDVYGNGVLKGTTTVDADTGGAQVLACVDVPATSFGQTEADAITVKYTLLVNPAGGPYPHPDIYTI